MSATVLPKRQRLGAGERREQLMSAAVEVLAAQGYQNTTAAGIAELAGVSKGLLWNYFADLEDLFEQTAHRILTTLSSAVGAAIDLDAPAPDVIRAAIGAAAAIRLTHATGRRALREITLNLRTPDGRLRLGQADLEGLQLAQETIFRRGQSDGDFRESLDPRILAVTYGGAVESMLEYLDAHPDADAEAHSEGVAEILLGGIQVSAPE